MSTENQLKKELATLRTQLTEARAACAAKTLLLETSVSLSGDLMKDNADLLKRLADAEKERDDAVRVWQLAYNVLTERFGLTCLSIQAPGFAAAKYEEVTTELSRLQAEAKELRETLSRIANDDKVSSIQSNPHYNPRCIATQALSDAARTQPKP